MISGIRGFVNIDLSTSTPIDPFTKVEWVKRDAVILDWKNKNPDGSPKAKFEQRGVEFPSTWSQQAVNIVTSKYFRGRLNTPERETSLKEVISRVTGWLAAQGVKQGYFDQETALIFDYELRHIILNQMATFNSPVWFNVGRTGEQAPQCSACFILDVDDTLESILELGRLEGMIFKEGSGAGVSLGKIRSSYETIKSGGLAGGPVSFAKGLDSMAGVIKSGGSTRKAAKMLVLPVDHPDIEKYVNCKVKEEEKARALKAAGFEPSMDDPDVFYQNANNSVRVTGEFMEAVQLDKDFELKGIKDKYSRKVSARDLMNQIAKAAWACADPGLQYDDNINNWHTTPASGRQRASNPCSEFLYLDWSACNLVSINLLKFLRADGSFSVDQFKHVVEIMITAQDIIVDGSSYPDPRIKDMAHRHRPLGLGYSNLGSILMYKGLAYDSDEARQYAAAITALMHGCAYNTSAYLASHLGPFEALAESNEKIKNRDAIVEVVRKHSMAASTNFSPVLAAKLDLDLFKAAKDMLDTALEGVSARGARNSQVTLLAPTGTISFMMDCDTTGIEPLTQLMVTKSLVGGGSIQITFEAAKEVLKSLGCYDSKQIDEICAYFKATGGRVRLAPHLLESHYGIFDTAFGWKDPTTGATENSLSYMAHIKMMAAVQPFLSGGISKTVNLPESATVEDFFNAYLQSWKLGIKCLALYRDNCKAQQPLATTKVAPASAPQMEAEEDTDYAIVKWSLPDERPSVTTKFRIGSEFEGFLTVGMYPDSNRPGEIFLRGAKAGSTLHGFIDAFTTAVSIGLQYGVPLEKFIDKFKGIEFAPRGFTGRDDIRSCKSIIDFVFRWIEQRFLQGSLVTTRTIQLRTAPRKTKVVDRMMMPWEDGYTSPATQVASTPVTQAETSSTSSSGSVEECRNCGGQLEQAGACKRCRECGSTSGCG